MPSLLPADVQAEQAVLGSVILAPHLLADMPDLRPGHFYQPLHGDIYGAVLEHIAAGKPTDPVLLASTLTTSQSFRTAGGASYLLDLTGQVASIHSGPYYARIVQEKALHRDIIGVGERMVQEAYGQEDGRAILDLAQSLLSRVSEHTGIGQPRQVMDLFARVIERSERDSASQVQIRTGLADVDRITGGFKPGQLVVVGARSGVGKTSFAVQTALHVAERDVPVAMFSMEMTIDEIAGRVLSLVTGVPVQAILDGTMSDRQMADVFARLGRPLVLPIHLDDTPAPTPTTLATTARQLVAKEGVKLLVVDYVQRMSPARRHDNRNAELSEILRCLKTLARETETVVLAGSQLSRDSVKDNRRPGLHDLRDSGTIEAEADVVILLSHGPDVTYCDVAKHRNGAKGEVDLIFDGPRCQFKCRARPEQNEDYWSVTRPDLR